jgi:hypothetical protein
VWESFEEQTRGVSHCGLNAKKEELWKLKYFILQKYNLQKNPLKETKILQGIITLITNLKFQDKPKISSFKNPPIKIDLFPTAQNPFS